MSNDHENHQATGKEQEKILDCFNLGKKCIFSVLVPNSKKAKNIN